MICVSKWIQRHNRIIGLLVNRYAVGRAVYKGYLHSENLFGVGSQIHRAGQGLIQHLNAIHPDFRRDIELCGIEEWCVMLTHGVSWSPSVPATWCAAAPGRYPDERAWAENFGLWRNPLGVDS